LACDERYEDSLNHEDNVLLNVLRQADTIKSLLDGDEDGYLEVSMMGMGTGPITFLMAHYGEGHRVVVEGEYGEIKSIKPPLGEIIRLHQAYEGNDVCIYCGKPVDEWEAMEKCPARYKN
jgi:hypothetical protein